MYTLIKSGLDRLKKLVIWPGLLVNNEMVRPDFARLSQARLQKFGPCLARPAFGSAR